MKRKPFSDLTGATFGYLTIISLEIKRGNSESVWLCRCKCGNEKRVLGMDLTNGSTKSCGCYRNERIRATISKHNKKDTPEYHSWNGLKGRCYNKNNPKYKNYGARGISVCDRWMGYNGFVNFLSDMGVRPSPEHSLDRIDVNGNYEPNNCRWALPITQSRNRQYNHILIHDGKSMSIAEWSEVTGIKYDTILARIKYYGWSTKDALTINDGRKSPRAA